jgi:nucleoside phosphorylase
MNSIEPSPPPVLSHLVVALPCEAKPLVAHYRLKRRLREEAFPVYERDGLCLTVSGIGKTAMAAAVAYSHMALGAQRHAVLMNIGVAGHRTHAIGHACLAHKITDADSGRRWYPPLAYQPPCASEHVCTVARPQPGYPEPVLYDMEASGFYETATRFSTSELVQCVKIVSDNASSPAEQVNARQVAELIECHIGLVDGLLQQLRTLAEPLRKEELPLLEPFTERWHFTVQQQLQLKRLLQRWAILAPDNPPDIRNLGALKQAGEVLQWLQRRADELPCTFP